MRQVARHEADRASVAAGVEHRLGDQLVATGRRVGHAVQDPEHDDEDRHLRHQRQARGHRIDLVLLVELHHLFVELLAVALVLVLQLAHLRRQPLHLEHALGALQVERGDQQHHHHGDHRDRDRVVGGDRVEPGQQRGWDFEDAGDHHESGLQSGGSGAQHAPRWSARRCGGTGSNPDGPNGRQRSRRRTVSHSPRPAAVGLDRLARVLRAGREEPARRRPALRMPAGRRRSRAASGAADGTRRRASPSPSPAAAAARSAADRTSVRSPVGCGADQQRSRPAASTRVSRRIARRRRRSRLRVTAGPRARPMRTPPTSSSSKGRDTTCTTERERRIRVPSCARRRKASRPRIRSIKPTGGRGPWRDGS